MPTVIHDISTNNTIIEKNDVSTSDIGIKRTSNMDKRKDILTSNTTTSDIVIKKDTSTSNTIIKRMIFQ